MATDDAWHRGFQSVVLKPLRANPEAVQAYKDQNWDWRAERGNVSAEDDIESSLWEAFLHQRSHADAARHLFVDAGLAGFGGRISVLDVGCGAGTVAVALSEAFRKAHNTGGFDYFGVDHNDHAGTLAVDMMNQPGVIVGDTQGTIFLNRADARSAMEKALTRASIPIVTTSYLLKQNGLARAFPETFATTLARLVDVAEKVGDQLRYLGVDASYGGWTQLNQVLTELTKLDVTAKVDIWEWTDHDLRFPSLYPAKEGRYRQHLSRTNNLLRWSLRLHR